MRHFDEPPYQTKSAVLFVIFNRPDTTLKVFEQIRNAKPARLYVSADGARAHKPGEAVLCAEARSVTDRIDWECEVKTLFNKENLGCKDAVSAAITWFFDNEEEGIILEDDCLPAHSFFKFCDTLLDEYRHDTRVRHITGCNLQQGKKWGSGTYYFSNRTHVWGWASWRRVWNDYDKNLEKYNAAEIKDKLQSVYADPLVADTWVNIFTELKAGKINSWAYQLDFINLFNNALTIIPNENLISNIGFGDGATHTVDVDNVYADVPLQEIEEITAPVYMLPEKQADMNLLIPEFHIEEKRRKQKLLRKRVKRWFKSLFASPRLAAG
ncbi:MAG: nucleotide-diphospho-sugar transferase [Bacteroidota bacterium]